MCLTKSESSNNILENGSGSKVSACNAGDPGSISGLGRSPGEGDGNPLQHSCLENPMDGGAWQATVHGVPKSGTRLSDFTHSLTHSKPRSTFLIFILAVCQYVTLLMFHSLKIYVSGNKLLPTLLYYNNNLLFILYGSFLHCLLTSGYFLSLPKFSHCHWLIMTSCPT